MRFSASDYIQFLNTIPDAAIVFDKAGKMVMANELASALLAYHSGELPEKSIQTVIIGPITDEFFTSRTRPMGIGPQLSARRRDDSTFPIDVLLKPVELDGELLNVCLFRDITQRLQTAEILRASESSYRLLFESMQSGFALHQIICNDRGEPIDYRFLEVNPAFERLTGLRASLIVGRLVSEVLPDLESAWVKRYGVVALTGQPEHFTTYSHELDRHFEITAYCPQHGQFAVVFEDVTERKLTEERMELQLRRVAALRAIDAAITGSLDLRLVLNVVLDQTNTQLGMDAACVLLLNPHTQTLTYVAGRGFRTFGIKDSRLRLGEDLAGRTIIEHRAIHLRHPFESPEFTRAVLLHAEAFLEYCATPLIAKGRIIGVLEVFHRAHREIDEEWLTFLETLGDQTAIAVDSILVFDNLQRTNIELSLAYDATIEGWSRAMDLRDKETEGHTQRVTALTEQLARAMRVGETEIVHIRRGALLHDIGKLGVPDHILLKPEHLTAEEWVIMRQHPQLAYDMLKPIAYLGPALDIPYCHHEKWDGTGYPRGLQGERIPLAARIFAVVDVWDALRSDRPYRKAWPENQALAHIRSLAGTHFDPQVVSVFLRTVVETPDEG